MNRGALYLAVTLIVATTGTAYAASTNANQSSSSSNSGYSIEGRGGGVATSKNPPSMRPVGPPSVTYVPGSGAQNRSRPPPQVQR